MRTWLTLLLFALLVPAVRAQDIHVENLTANEYQKRFNDLVQHGYRPVKVWSKTLGTFDNLKPSFGFWATFRKMPSGPAWISFHGIDAATYQNQFNKWVGQGFMPTDMNVACVNGDVRYCVIFEKVPNAKTWAARHGLNQAQFEAANQEMHRKGLALKLKSSCRSPQGMTFAALWQAK